MAKKPKRGPVISSRERARRALQGASLQITPQEPLLPRVSQEEPPPVSEIRRSPKFNWSAEGDLLTPDLLKDEEYPDLSQSLRELINATAAGIQISLNCKKD